MGVAHHGACRQGRGGGVEGWVWPTTVPAGRGGGGRGQLEVQLRYSQMQARRSEEASRPEEARRPEGASRLEGARATMKGGWGRVWTQGRWGRVWTLPIIFCTRSGGAWPLTWLQGIHTVISSEPCWPLEPWA